MSMMSPECLYEKTNDNKTVSEGLTDTVMQIANLHNVAPMDIIQESQRICSN